jgi:methionyl-tRNA synthetase
LADTEPWKLIKSDEAKTGEILNISLQLVAHLGKIMESFLPNTSKNIGEFINKNITEINASKFEVLPEGSLIKKPSLLFQKIEDEQVESQIEKLKASKVETTAKVNFKPNTTFDDFQKLDLKLATITSAEKVKKADKLLQLKLNVGGVERNVVSGIAQHYNPEDIVGKTVLYLANLEPRKIRGVVSEGMILMAENAEGELSFMAPEKDFESGAGVN